VVIIVQIVMIELAKTFDFLRSYGSPCIIEAAAVKRDERESSWDDASCISGASEAVGGGGGSRESEGVFHILRPGNTAIQGVVDGWAVSAAACLAGGPGLIPAPGQTYD
jgi:hypothetical protein